MERPFQVLGLCLILLIAGLVLDGSLWRLYQIQKNQQTLAVRIREETEQIGKIQGQLGQLKDPAYIEKQARERLEFLEKDDLLFVFSED